MMKGGFYGFVVLNTKFEQMANNILINNNTHGAVFVVEGGKDECLLEAKFCRSR